MGIYRHLKMKFLSVFTLALVSQKTLGLPSKTSDYFKNLKNAYDQKKLVSDIEDKFEVYWYRLVNSGWCPSEYGCRENNYERIMSEIRKNDYGLRQKSSQVKNVVDGFFDTDNNNADLTDLERLGLTQEQAIKVMDHYGVFIVSDLTCGGRNRKCKPETLRTLEKYADHLDKYYGYNGRNLELTDEEKVKRYVKARMVVNGGFVELDKKLNGWKKFWVKGTSREYKRPVEAVFNYFINSFSDMGDATDDVLKANGNMNTDQKQATYDDLKNDIAKNFVQLCNGFKYNGIKCRKFHWID